MIAPNQTLLSALDECVAACENCASACLREEHVQMMVRCIALDRDCADICALTARLLARGSEHGKHLLRECAEICRLCYEECSQHEDEHCQLCALACRRCEEACRAAA
ncbi:four-helix bundle copper-binding protein [Hymenobacter busanensis]|uniref:Four-helix bundle copper-binding protein n=1 Tax=Hymenobacter busanensis TaxID=2607656 RepID=A0A7L4ZUZ2_9BACT|nr:four-helix bundle copper-binding protein [Hymenobacter busanensis]KAA9332374.1 four-helix bundle copper-binding protein [Hymenobacter busanensis]QHJ07289.1 four-helix bundle copper-binding protein [Hymenobacter busanensis]